MIFERLILFISALKFIWVTPIGLTLVVNPFVLSVNRTAGIQLSPIPMTPLSEAALGWCSSTVMVGEIGGR